MAKRVTKAEAAKLAEEKAEAEGYARHVSEWNLAVWGRIFDDKYTSGERKRWIVDTIPELRDRKVPEGTDENGWEVIA